MTGGLAAEMTGGLAAEMLGGMIPGTTLP